MLDLKEAISSCNVTKNIEVICKYLTTKYLNKKKNIFSKCQITDNVSKKDKIRVKFPESRKIGLNKWEVMLLEQLKDLGLGDIHARNVWMYSLNFAGMRVADILKTCWSDFHDGRLYCRMVKNSKLVSLKIPSKVLDILEH